MALSNQIIVVPSSKADLLGTGLEATAFDWDRVETIELSSRAYVYPSGDQNLSTVQAAQLAGDLIILQGIKSFKITAVEPQINTADGSGYKTVTGELPYEYEVMFDNNGVNLWKALRKFNSKDSYNCAFYDVEGNKIFTSNKAGDVFKGFQTKMLFVGQYKGKEGNNPAEVKMNIQLADNGEMDRQVWISGETLDFDAKSDLDGINDLYLNVSGMILNPSAVATVVVGTTLADRSQFVAGLPFSASNTTLNPNTFLIKKVLTTSPFTVSYIAPTAQAADNIGKAYSLTIPTLTFVTGASYSVVTATYTTTGAPLPTQLTSNVVQLASTKLLYKGISAGVTL